MTKSAQKTQKPATIPFIDLKSQRLRIADKINTAVLKTIESGAYVMGPEVKRLEQRLAKFAGSKYAISCASGTDALFMVLRALKVGPGDAIFVPAFTFVATGEVVALTGATPVFIDIDPATYNMDPKSLDLAIQAVKAKGDLTPKGVIPVDLYGLPADYVAIEALADAAGMWMMPDAAQGFGCTVKGRSSVTFGIAGATSFFPAKPLGCYGDGGAIFTDDAELAHTLESIRVHGQGDHKYDNVRIGLNGRLDAIQAAILNEKLEIYEDELAKRQQVADRYTAALADVAVTPVVPEGDTCVWAQYTLRVLNRDQVMARLKEVGVPTMVYYPKPLNQQEPYKQYPSAPGGVPVSDAFALEVMSLPMHPYLDVATQDYIIEQVKMVLSDRV